jgi:hypothetical protein
MHKTNQIQSVIIYLFFISILIFGLIWKGFSNGIVSYIHVGIILFFVTLIINQLSVWKVFRENENVVFSNFLGIVKKVLNEKNDYQSVEGYISHDPTSDLEKGEHLKLITDKGVFRFHSWDYKDFNLTLNDIFQERIDLKNDFKKIIKKERKFHIDRTWIYFGLIILILLVYYLIENLL